MGRGRSKSNKAPTNNAEREPETNNERMRREQTELREKWSKGIPDEIQQQLEQERKEINEFLKRKIPERGWIDEDIGGQIFERETLKRAKYDLKNAIDGGMSDDDVWDIVYNDGTYVRANEVLQSGKKVKMTGIKSIINENENTTMFAGKVKFSSMLEEDAKEYVKRAREGRHLGNEPSAGYGSDWRVNFE